MAPVLADATPRMRLSILAPVLAAAVALAGAALASHGPATTVLVNVHVGESLSCSTDSLTSPDLQARVHRNGGVVGETRKAQDQKLAEWFTLLEIPVSSYPATFQIEVREAEPGGFLGLGTSWVQCDVDPGAGAMLNVTVTATGTKFSGTGNANQAARVSGYAAPATAIGHPAPATLTATRTTATEIALSFPANPADATGVKQTLLVAGEDAQGLAATATTATLTGRRENTDYYVRVLREVGDWRVAPDYAAFRTANLPPPAPSVTVNPGPSSANVTWDVAAHDLARIEVHVGATSDFAPSAATKRHEETAFAGRSQGTTTVRDLAPGKLVYVKVVAFDDRGAFTPSGASGVTPGSGAAPTPPTSPTPPTPPTSPTRPTPPSENRAPVAALVVTPPVIRVGETVIADATASTDPDGDRLTFSIRWADGSATTPASNAAHRYESAGVFTVEVTVADGQGATATAQSVVDVRPRSLIPGPDLALALAAALVIALARRRA